MMRKTLNILSLLILTVTVATAQGFGGGQEFGSGKKYDPVKWSGEVEKVSDTEYVLHYDAKIKDKWHVYSQFTPEDGPIPLHFEFLPESGATYTLDGPAKESDTHREYSDIFEVDEVFWEKTARLSQKIKLNDNTTSVIKSIIKHQSCIEDGVCINQEFYIVHDLAKNEVKTFTDYTAFEAYGGTSTADGNKAPPEEKEDKGYLIIFLGTLLAGLLVTFTPCVFPMIPMTISFFIKQNENKSKGKFNALFYGFCIVAIYVLISLPFHLFESLNPNIFNAISTNVYLNIFFFLVFVVFAISFLGAFEINIPNSWANKADKASSGGGLLGVFFMALTLIIVSFSCTGPALGLVLGSVLSTDGGATILTIAMLGFGLGLAFPFVLFALFPSWLTNLPKSGGWLNTVKVVFGLIELALAFKFLSNADLVLQLHLLERETFLAIWIAISAVLTLYLLGKIKTPHDDEGSRLSVGRLLLGITTLWFTLYLIPGLWGAPLKLISGFPPPMEYSESPNGIGNSSVADIQFKDGLPEGGHVLPNGILAFNDYEEGLAYAKTVNKTVLIDFTGHACVNCRKMEERVWIEPAILDILKNDIVLISLYVDDRRKLPEGDRYVSKITGKRVQTIGDKWSEFQTIRYQANAQPYYVLMDHDESNLNTPVGYTPDAEEYRAWLKEGITRFNNN
ncbi:cytochrome c biogenesis protein CcdA [Dokdonia sp.]|uniref:protein-disulfide reductase DsbD family protein n=1 Tax=Dokdonia sp. TaxID=2024995 RepID=UPI003265A6D2